MWRVRRPAGGPVTGTGSLRGSSFRLPCKRTTASSRLTSLRRLPAFPPSLILSFSFLLSFSLSLSRLSSLSLSFSSSSVCQLSAHLSLRSDPVCAFARSLLSHLLVRPVDRPLLHPSLSSSLCRHPLRLLSSFARKRCHTRERGPPPSSFPAASLHGVDAMMLFSRSHHSATRVQQRLSLSLPLISRSERSCREFTSSFFLHYHLRLVLSSLFLRIS